MMFTLIEISRKQSHELLPSEHSSNSLLCQGKAGEWISEVHSAWCEDAVCLKRILGV